MLAYMYSDHMGWGWGVLAMLGLVMLLGLFLAVLVSLMRGDRNESARELLDQRLAAGEIGLEEHRQARAAISPDADDLPTAGPPAPAR